MADNKRLRVSKACDSCRRKKVKCDAIHPLCTNCETFKYECTYNDPTKKRGPPKGYIEAIEARLHRMEGLLGGLIKDKDPRADIVKAELDAMAREAEMTGLKLRRSKAYEEINNAMVAAATSRPTSLTAESCPSLSSTHDTSSLDSRQYSVAGQHHNHQMHVQQQQQWKQHTQPQYAANRSPSPRLHATAIHNGRSSISKSSMFLLNSLQAHEQGHQGQGQPQPLMQQQYGYQHQQDDPQTHNTYAGHKHRLHSYDASAETYHQSYSAPDISRQIIQQASRDSHILPPSGRGAGDLRRPSFAGQYPLVNPLTGYMPMPQESAEYDQSVILPSADVMDHLMSIHFRFVHPVLPMLHQKTLLDQIRRKESVPSYFLFAVLGLASRFSDNPIFRDPQPGADRPPCTVFYERAKVLIKDEYDHSQIMTVQALLLMAIQQMGFCESQKAWLYVGMAIRMAQDLGLNKELSEQEQSRNRLVAELRRRTWWSCYVVDRLVCAGLGRPLTITKRECEIGYPQYDEAEYDQSTGTMFSGSPTLIPNFIHLIRLSRIQGYILQFIKARAVECDESNDGYSANPNLNNDQDNGYPVDTSQAAFSALDKSLAEWRQRLPEPLQNPTRESPHFGLFLHMTYNTSIILLHRPEFFFSATSASLCTQAAATITDITEILMKANALSSMFLSCLYAIFSAGLIHFINIPNAKRSPCYSSPSPTISSTHGGSINHALTAKADLKRCIDALKHMSSHWVSAARRAKVLEDLLDLKHVSLKGLEEDSFKTTSLVPSWVVETAGYSSKALIVPREGHDRLRQQCRSKMMAIQSLLATDDEFRKMQRQDEDENGEESESEDEGEDGGEWDDYDMRSESSKEHDPTSDEMDVLTEVSNAIPARTNGVGLHSTEGINSLHQFPAHSTHDNQHQHQQQQSPLDADPMILISTATFGTPEHCNGGNSETVAVKSVSTLGPTDSANDTQSLITPMTLTTLGFRRDSSQSSSRKGSAPSIATAKPFLGKKQASMLDPFSMPSSIQFPDQSRGRQNGHGTTNHSNGPRANTVWSTDAHTQRSVAKAEPSPSRNRPFTPGAVRDVHEEATGRGCILHRPSFSDASSHMDVGVGSEEHDCEDLDVSWSDMPPTLGLDEWMAYIGALMMRWLASGGSSPRSTLSS